MRGDSTMKLSQQKPPVHRSRPLRTFLLLLAMAGCDPGADPGSAGGTVAGTGRTAIKWTLGGSTLTAASCQSQQIGSMSVAVASLRDSSPAAEFINVACGLDRYSMTQLPSGPVRIFVDGIHTSPSGSSCIRLSGQIDSAVGLAYPQSPIEVALHPVGSCP